MKDRNNEEFYDNALRWARLATLRFIRESDIADRTDVLFQCFTRELKTLMRKIKDELPPELQTYSPSWAAEVLQDLNRKGERARGVVRNFKKPRGEEPDREDVASTPIEKMHKTNAKAVQSPTFISRVNRASEQGYKLFSEYKNILW